MHFRGLAVFRSIITFHRIYSKQSSVKSNMYYDIDSLKLKKLPKSNFWITPFYEFKANRLPCTIKNNASARFVA